MKLLGRYRFLITGDTCKTFQGQDQAIGDLFARLLRGEEAAMRNIENAGIEVRQLRDRDEIITVPEAGSE